VKRANVFLFGDINLDISMFVPEFPQPGQDVYVDKLLFNLGGSATNTGIVISQLGLIPRLLGSVGMDPNGDYLITALKDFGLDSSRVQRKTQIPSGQIFLTVLPDGERTMYSFRGANVLTNPQDIPLVWFETTDLLHLSGYTFLQNPQRETALSLIATAHEKNIPISMDSGLDPVVHAHAEMKPVLSQLDICILGQREGTILTGRDNPEDIISAAFDLGIKCVALKMGTQGCIIGLNGDVFRLPALSIQVIDTTGSGDAFSAGILISWLNRFTLPDMCMLANSLGAYAATQYGPAATNLNWSVFQVFLKEQMLSQTTEINQAIESLLNCLSHSMGQI
jgi:ribokinase